MSNFSGADLLSEAKSTEVPSHFGIKSKNMMFLGAAALAGSAIGAYMTSDRAPTQTTLENSALSGAGAAGAALLFRNRKMIRDKTTGIWTSAKGLWGRHFNKNNSSDEQKIMDIVSSGKKRKYFT